MRLRRRWFNARVRFHDWMWTGSTPLHKAAQRLPLHFSDPHMLDRRRLKRLLADGDWQPTVGPQSGISMTSGTSVTYNFRDNTWGPRP